MRHGAPTRSPIFSGRIVTLHPATFLRIGLTCCAAARWRSRPSRLAVQGQRHHPGGAAAPQVPTLYPYGLKRAAEYGRAARGRNASLSGTERRTRITDIFQDIVSRDGGGIGQTDLCVFDPGKNEITQGRRGNGGAIHNGQVIVKEQEEPFHTRNIAFQHQPALRFAQRGKDFTEKLGQLAARLQGPLGGGQQEAGIGVGLERHGS